ncbi:hypothetical protein COCVIDRAFT_101585 [Bipolaris victoriae FI3]|uniref:Uncharacterized protein n=1 Tax=Bipolaris victoriae (strain FI3) TaxID=930091 RepID=W7EDF2_BIPV3|nr:hypothetical protein COCVIDRAFT_101585 [Bipolaris victoriae FI3]
MGVWAVTSLLSPPLRGDLPPDQGSDSVTAYRVYLQHLPFIEHELCSSRTTLFPTRFARTCSPRSTCCSILICNTRSLPPNQLPNFFQTVVRKPIHLSVQIRSTS